MLRFVDGMSHYTDAFLGEKWDVRSANAGGGSITQSLTSGRFGAGGITFVSGNGAAGGQYGLYIQKNYDGVGTIICGLAVKQTGTQNVLGGRLLTFVESSTTQVGIDIMQSGQLRVIRSTVAGDGIILKGIDQGGSSQQTVLGTSVSAISSSSDDFLEVKVIHHPTAGSVEIKRNGSAFYTLSDVNTAISGTNLSASVCVGGFASVGIGAGGTTRHLQDLKAIISDFQLLDTVVDGSDALNPVDFIGDRHWEPITPTADGADTAWTITGSANHFANVDEVPPNNSDFNSTATLNARDGFIVSSPTGPSAASALLAFTMYCQKNTGGSNAIKAFLRSGGASYRNGTEFQVPSPWAFRQSFMASKPGGGAITIADVGTHQAGYEKTI